MPAHCHTQSSARSTAVSSLTPRFLRLRPPLTAAVPVGVAALLGTIRSSSMPHQHAASRAFKRRPRSTDNRFQGGRAGETVKKRLTPLPRSQTTLGPCGVCTTDASEMYQDLGPVCDTCLQEIKTGVETPRLHGFLLSG